MRPALVGVATATPQRRVSRATRSSSLRRFEQFAPCVGGPGSGRRRPASAVSPRSFAATPAQSARGASRQGVMVGAGSSASDDDVCRDAGRSRARTRRPRSRGPPRLPSALVEEAGESHEVGASRGRARAQARQPAYVGGEGADGRERLSRVPDGRGVPADPATLGRTTRPDGSSRAASAPFGRRTARRRCRLAPRSSTRAASPELQRRQQVVDVGEELVSRLRAIGPASSARSRPAARSRSPRAPPRRHWTSSGVEVVSALPLIELGRRTASIRW